jgi:hypothetical protein
MSEVDRVVDPVSQVELVVPPFASPERAINRAALDRDGGLRRIRFYPDGTNPWPFWEDEGELFMPTPGDLGLSSELETDLRDWYNSWNANVRYGGEPLDPAWLTPWLARGDELAARVQEQVWDFAEIVPEHRKGE